MPNCRFSASIGEDESDHGPVSLQTVASPERRLPGGQRWRDTAALVRRSHRLEDTETRAALVAPLRPQRPPFPGSEPPILPDARPLQVTLLHSAPHSCHKPPGCLVILASPAFFGCVLESLNQTCLRYYTCRALPACAGDADFRRKRAATGSCAAAPPEQSSGSRAAAGGCKVRSRAVRVPPPSAAGAATPSEPAGRAPGRSRGASSHAADDVLAALELARSPITPVGKAVAAANGRSGREGHSGAPATAERLPVLPKTASSAASEGRKPSRTRQPATPRGARESGGSGCDRRVTRHPGERGAPKSGLSHTLKGARAPPRSAGKLHTGIPYLLALPSDHSLSFTWLQRCDV